MEHMGKIIAARIEEFGIKKVHIYRKLGLTKAKFDLLLDTHNIQDREVEMVCNIIRNDYDFRVDFPWIKPSVFSAEGKLLQFNNPAAVYENEYIKEITELRKELKVLTELLKSQNRIPTN